MAKSTWGKIRFLYNRKEKQGMVLLLAGALFSGILEIGGIGIIIPFVSFILNPESGNDNSVFIFISQLFDYSDLNKTFFVFTLLVIALYFVKNLFILFFHKANIGFRTQLYRRHAGLLFRKYLNSPYKYHLDRNSADLLNNLQNIAANATNGFVTAFLGFMNTSIISIFLLLFLFIYNWKITLVLCILSGFLSLFYIKGVRRKLVKTTKVVQKATAEKNKAIIQGIGNIKVTKVLQKENYFSDVFNRESRKERTAMIYQIMAGMLPRYVTEVFILAVILGYINILLFQGTSSDQIFVELSIITLVGLRLFPQMSQMLGFYSRIRIFLPPINLLYKEMKSLQETDVSFSDNTALEGAFHNKIDLMNISFSYPDGNKVLDDVTLSIEKGKTYGFVGESGAGKTTLIDIILGLFHCSEGNIILDGKDITYDIKSWQRNLAYIPQNIYLFDDSIRQNIAICRNPEDIDDSKIWKALKAAHLDDFVESLDSGLETIIGEMGIKISGGQRQRMGIARALYENKNVLVMDEATAALDYSTEKEIMEVLDNLHNEKTQLIVAHRLSTIKNCDLIYYMENGRIRNSGSFNELLDKDSLFRELVKSS